MGKLTHLCRTGCAQLPNHAFCKMPFSCAGPVVTGVGEGTLESREEAGVGVPAGEDGGQGWGGGAAGFTPRCFCLYCSLCLSILHSLTPESPVPMTAATSTAAWPPFAKRLLCAGTCVFHPTSPSVPTPTPGGVSKPATFVLHTKADKLRGGLQGDLTHSETYRKHMGPSEIKTPELKVSHDE